MKISALKIACRLLAATFICLWFALNASAQVQTQTTTKTGEPSKQVSVERGEVVSVDGNDLIVKMEDGTLRHFPNVPETARVNVDGQSMGIHDLKPGMKLERTITVTSTPQTITTVHSVTGTIWHVNPPNSVVLKLEDGTNQQFKIPQGQKFNVNGQMLDAFALKKGMQITATKIVEEPSTMHAKETQVSGTMPPPPPPPADTPILIAREKPTTPEPAPAQEQAQETAPEKAPAQLPQTASPLPLLGLLGTLLSGASLGLWKLRRR